MTVTRRPDPAENLVPVDVQARRLPASMLAIAGLLTVLFLTLVLVMILAVASDDSLAAPTVDDLEIPTGARVVASMETCTDRACDGVGVALEGEGDGAPASLLATTWRENGWRQLSCVDGGTLCFGADDLRLSMTPWTEVDPASMPMLVEEVSELSIDPRSITFVHYYRCGTNHPCE